MKVEVAVVGSPFAINTVSVDVGKQHLKMKKPDVSELRGCVKVKVQWVGRMFRAQASPIDLTWSLWTWRKQHFQMKKPDRAQELCESRGGRPGLPPSLIVLVSEHGV